jgi:hypothetical protein
MENGHSKRSMNPKDRHGTILGISIPEGEMGFPFSNIQTSELGAISAFLYVTCL